MPENLGKLLAWPFVGPSGLRDGWRVAIFFALFIVGSEGIAALWPHPVAAGDLLAAPVLLSEGLQLAVVVAATLLLGRFERRSLGDYGLPLRWDSGFGRGLALGFGTASVLVLALAGIGVLHLSGPALAPSAVLGNALIWAFVFLVVGLFEELLLRGYAQTTLARSAGFWPAAVLLSVLFALLHARNPGETPLGLIAVGCFGLFFCYTLRTTGNLWFAIGFHAAWDWTESFFYGVPDSGTRMAGHLLSSTSTGATWLSGGTAGPEGSVLVVLVLGAAAVLVQRWRDPRSYGHLAGTH